MCPEIFSRELGQRSNFDLLQRSSVETSYGHLVQIALQRDLAQQLLQSTCHLRTIFHGDLHKANLQNLYNLPSLLPKTALRMNTVLSPLVSLLSCMRGAMEDFGTFTAFPFRILTTHCYIQLFGVSCRDNFSVFCVDILLPTRHENTMASS